VLASTKTVVEFNFTISEIDGHIYGSLTEHIGRCISKAFMNDPRPA
jgi:alpha-L-arabinofuranosidase